MTTDKMVDDPIAVFDQVTALHAKRLEAGDDGVVAGALAALADAFPPVEAVLAEIRAEREGPKGRACFQAWNDRLAKPHLDRDARPDFRANLQSARQAATEALIVFGKETPIAATLAKIRAVTATEITRCTHAGGWVALQRDWVLAPLAAERGAIAIRRQTLDLALSVLTPALAGAQESPAPAVGGRSIPHQAPPRTQFAKTGASAWGAS